MLASSMEMLHAVWAAAGVLLILLATGGSVTAAVSAPKVVSEHTPDTHSLEDYVSGIVTPGMTQKQKAHALWGATAKMMYHWTNPIEPPTRRDGGMDNVTDPIQQLNVYGYTLCFCSAAPMEAIWRAAGLEAREFGLPGHVTNEVWYDGAYHYLDVEVKGFYRKPDGRVASIRECGLRPAELMVKAKLPKEFFPLSKQPFRTYLSKMVYAGIADMGPSWYASYRARSGHAMNVTIRKGETYYRSWENVGRYICDYKRFVAPGDFGMFDCRYGPKDKVTGRTFGNGILIYAPDLTTATDEYEDGVFAAENIVKTAAGLAAGKGAKQATAVFRFQLPYVIAGDPNRLEVEGDTTDAAALTIDAEGGVDVLISTDNGGTWAETGLTGAGTVDLSRFVVRTYGYQLKFVLAGGAVLKSFRSQTSFQLAPTSLPALKKGANRMTFDLGTDPFEMMVVNPLTWSGTEKQFSRFVHSRKNIRWYKNSWTRAICTGDKSKPGHIIYELAAPAGKRLRKVTMDVGGSLRWRQLAEDKVEVSVAENKPAGFRKVGAVRGGPYSSHWRRRLPVAIDLPRKADVRKFYVRFDIFNKFRACVSDLRFRLYFEDEKPKTNDTSGLVITHGWIEEGKVRTSTRTGPKPGRTYTVKTGAKFERPLFICMEIPGAAGPRAKKDPMGLATYKKRPASFFPPEAAGKSNEKILLKLDREGLAKSDTMEEILLRGENKILAGQMVKMLGYRPTEAVRSLLEKKRKAGPKETRWHRALALLDERKASSRQAFLRRFLPKLEADDFTVEYLRRSGETGTAADIPPLLEAMDKVSAPTVELLLAAAAMALGDRSVCEKAEALARRTRSVPRRIDVDASLVTCPGHGAPARKRLLAMLDSDDVNVRWSVLRQVAFRTTPTSADTVEDIAAKGLADANPWMRLAGLSILWKLDAGEKAVRKAAKTEPVQYLKDAYAEFLAR